MALVLLSLFFFINPFLQGGVLAQGDGTTFFEGCSRDVYYEEILSQAALENRNITRNELSQLLQSTHRRVLPYTNTATEVDVWRALMDVDEGDTPDTVRLIYKNVDVAAALFNNYSHGWNREHVWPKSRGVGDGGDDYVDIHHLRPSDWNVNAARGNQYFAACGFTGQPNCRTVTEAPNATTDGRVFAPPPEHRGDVARALFYMAVRYTGTDGGKNLVLTDCPDSQTQNTNVASMAYLSQLLLWHEQDPPDDRERERNDRVCQYWQGNRNPFIDHEDWVPLFFGTPQQAVDDCAASQMPTPQPTSPPPPALPTPGGTTTGDCASLASGDVRIVAVNSDTDDMVALVALVFLPPQLQLVLTDNAWTGTAFRANEGSRVLIVPNEGIAPGTVFGYGEGLPYGEEWQRLAGSFSLSTRGDNVFLYCKDDDTSRNSGIFLTGCSYSGDWLAPGLAETDYGTSFSALPSSLVSSAIALPHFDNYLYTATRTGTRTALQEALNDPASWTGSNAQRYTAEQAGASFRVETETSTTSGGDKIQMNDKIPPSLMLLLSLPLF